IVDRADFAPSSKQPANRLFDREANLHNQPATVAQTVMGLGDQALVNLESRGPAEDRYPGLELAHLALGLLRFGLAHVRRIGNNKIKLLAGKGREQVS